MHRGQRHALMWIRIEHQDERQQCSGLTLLLAEPKRVRAEEAAAAPRTPQACEAAYTGGNLARLQCPVASQVNCFGKLEVSAGLLQLPKRGRIWVQQLRARQRCATDRGTNQRHRDGRTVDTSASGYAGCRSQHGSWSGCCQLGRPPSAFARTQGTGIPRCHALHEGGRAPGHASACPMR